MKTIGAGAGLTLLVTLILVAAWGRTALVPGLAMGTVATALQAVATARLKRNYRGGNAQFFGAVGVGMALRMLGIGVMFAAIVLDQVSFPALPTALGFLGVVIPLLFLEVRFVQ